MAENSKAVELTDVYVNEFMEKLFYFCLKKTGNEFDARDLLSDISLCVISSFNRGAVPVNYPAYTWKIARNRYAAWADSKRLRNSTVAPSDIGDYEICDESADVESELVRSEQLSLLRRELAFISSDYRKIVAAHYIDGLKTSELAASLGIPRGTLLTKLARSRKILKEGMFMAREFGKRSYNPEDLIISTSGSQPSGLPQSAVERSIPKNILCEANNNPSTAEELAMELGIPLPYIEDEISLLVNSELLTKLDNGKYLTSFFIASRECVNEVNDLSCEYAEKCCEPIWDLAGKALKEARRLGICLGAYNENEAQMYFAFLIEQRLIIALLPENVFFKFKRRDGGSWGLIGREAGFRYRLPVAAFSNCCGCSTLKGDNIHWNGYQNEQGDDSVFTTKRHSEDAIGGYSLELLKEIADGKRTVEFSETEVGMVRLLAKNGFLVKNGNGEYDVNAVILGDGLHERVCSFIDGSREYKQLSDEAAAYLSEVKLIISKYANPYLEKDFDYCVGMTASTRDIFARLWADRGLYKGNSTQFCAISY